MPGHYSIDVKKKIVRTTFRGVVTTRDIADLASSLARDPQFEPNFSELATFKGSCDLQLSFLDFQYLSRLDPFSRTSKRALVASARSALYGILRMFQISRNEVPNIKILENSENALKWLMGERQGVSPEEKQEKTRHGHMAS